MFRKLIPALLTAVALVGIPTLPVAAAHPRGADSTCDASTVPPGPDPVDVEPGDDDAVATDTDADTDALGTAGITALWSDRCDIDPTIYLTFYPQYYDIDMALPSAAPTGQVVSDASAGTGARTSAESAEGGIVAPVPAPPQVPGILDDNTFIDAGQSRWIDVDDDRESTFALDVDTGSYSIAKTLVASGWQPEPDSIRPEEWVNAFGYGDVNEGPAALAATIETAAAADGAPALMRIGVSTVELAAEDRAPANVTFVIDTSGSMDIRSRLGMVKASLALLTRNLREDDTVAIVIYGSDAAPLLAPTKVADWRTIIDAIDSLQPGGSTNMEAGLYLGYEMARESYDPDGVNVVVLASDGVANVGSTDAEVLTDTITRAGEEGIKLVTVGFGMGNYNDVLMEQLANQGDGFYSYVDTYAEAVRLFVDELTPTLTTVAKDAKVQVVFDDEVVARYRLVGYENRRLDDSQFRDDSVDAGEFGAGHHATAVYELELLDGADPDAVAGEVRLRWEDPETGDVIETIAPFSVGTGEASPTLRLATLVANAAEYFRGDDDVTARGISIDGLEAEAAALRTLGVDGAAEFAEFLHVARHAQVIGE